MACGEVLARWAVCVSSVWRRRARCGSECHVLGDSCNGERRADRAQAMHNRKLDQHHDAGVAERVAVTRVVAFMHGWLEQSLGCSRCTLLSVPTRRGDKTT